MTISFIWDCGLKWTNINNVQWERFWGRDYNLSSNINYCQTDRTFQQSLLTKYYACLNTKVLKGTICLAVIDITWQFIISISEPFSLNVLYVGSLETTFSLLEIYQCHMSLTSVYRHKYSFIFYLSRFGKKTERRSKNKSLKAKT